MYITFLKDGATEFPCKSRNYVLEILNPENRIPENPITGNSGIPLFGLTNKPRKDNLMGKAKKIIYIKGIPYRNWYFKFPAMSEAEEEKLSIHIKKLREKKGK